VYNEMKLWAPLEPEPPSRGIGAAMAQPEQASHRAISNPISCFPRTAYLSHLPMGSGRLEIYIEGSPVVGTCACQRTPGPAAVNRAQQNARLPDSSRNVLSKYLERPVYASSTTRCVLQYPQAGRRTAATPLPRRYCSDDPRPPPRATSAAGVERRLESADRHVAPPRRPCVLMRSVCGRSPLRSNRSRCALQLAGPAAAHGRRQQGRSMLCMRLPLG